MAVKKYLDLTGLQNYHVGILKNFTSDVTYGNTYTLLSTEPADWSTNYANYYTKSGDNYVPVSGSTAPTFAVDTYYSAVKELQLNKYPSASINDGAIVKGNPSNTKLFSIEDLKTDLGLGNAAYQDVTSTYNSSDTVAPISGAGVAQAIQGITEPMIFQGGVYVGVVSDTVKYYSDDQYTTELTGVKTGFTYKVLGIKEGTTPQIGGKDVEVDDTIIAKVSGSPATTTWTLIPSGDEPSGTVTSVAAGTGLQIGDGTGEQSITSTGTINLKPATASTIGGVKVAAVSTSNITLDEYGSISVATADASTLGVVSVAGTSGLSISNGAISVNVDNSTILNTNGTIGAKTAGVTDDSSTRTPYLGVVKVDDTTIKVDGNGTISAATATASTVGVVSPDGVVITVDNSGNITVPDATNSVKGVVKVDNTTITVNDNGAINAVKAGAVASTDTEGTVSANLGTVKGSVDNGVLVDSNGVLGINTITYGNNSDISALFA